MAFADWDVYNVAATVNIDVASPIVGTGSLRLADPDIASARANLVPKITSALPHALLKGKMRQLVKVVAKGGGGMFGIAAMQSARDLTAAGTAAYLGVLLPANGVVRILKVTNGLEFQTVLASATYAMDEGGIYAIELEWVVDVVELGGTRLIMRTGTALNFSDLVEVLSYTDISAPLITTLGEGPCMTSPGAANLADCRIDQTRLVLRT